VPSPKPLPKSKKTPKLDQESQSDNTGIDHTGPKREGISKPEPVSPPEHQPGSESGGASSPAEVYKPIELSQLRVIKVADKKARLFLNTETTQNNCEIQLREMGSETFEHIAIAASDVGICFNGVVTMNLVKDKRYVLNVDLERPLLGAVEIFASRKIQEQEIK